MRQIRTYEDYERDLQAATESRNRLLQEQSPEPELELREMTEMAREMLMEADLVELDSTFAYAVSPTFKFPRKSARRKSKSPSRKTNSGKNGDFTEILVPPPDDYRDRLLKNIPGEIIVLYITFTKAMVPFASLKPGPDGSQSVHLLPTWVPGAVFLFCLLATPLYQWRLLGVRLPLQLLISTMSFAVWAITIGGGYFKDVPAWVGLFILPGFTFLIPLIYGNGPTRPDEQKSNPAGDEGKK